MKSLLSFQRYCHASKLLRGLVPHTPGSLHLLDQEYLGQAAVRPLRAHHWCAEVQVPCIIWQSPSSSDYLFSLQHMLSKVGMWDFDIFLFDRLTNGNTNLVVQVVFFVSVVLPLSQHSCYAC